MIWKTRRDSLDFNEKGNASAALMGILNTTPDSFSDGGLHQAGSRAVRVALEMQDAGAAIIDVGGESTRPGAPPVSAEEEIARTAPVIESIRAQSDVLISIDTSKAAVALAAIAAGADIVNDVTGLLGDPDMSTVCAESGVGVVVMHMQGTPRTMQQNPQYTEGVVAEVADFFRQRCRALVEAGIQLESLCFDPGIGFGKTLDQNLALIQQLAALQSDIARPLLLGVSRKSFLGTITGIETPEHRDAATAMITAMTCQQGVCLHRVHNVPLNKQALQLAASVSS
ncbi:dihydropteroate synthase [Verrucomicrobiaceae bacterium R5-34]|nr:dihydropteroate synthase [Verrucomicrobiaceae bacterium R5-34]